MTHPLLSGSPYAGYTYAYPHKTAYRRLDPPVELGGAWAQEPLGSLFLYLHVPFCEMRCGFCNLFTVVDRPYAGYLAAMERQARVVKEAIVPQGIARVALGGGTPTLLEAPDLERLLGVVETFGGGHGPCSVETSPATASLDRLQVLKEHGVERVSLGVQSFCPQELRALGRPGPLAHEAARRAQGLGFACLNLDLIYGIPGQTPASLADSLNQALAYEPQEIFLYPLYVRPLTGLDGRESPQDWDRQRLDLYRQGRDQLCEGGFRQLSMRHFSRWDPSAPDYCCQDDGMIGLGPGARSYTRSLHYSGEYAVGRSGVRSLVQQFLEAPESSHSHIHHGVRLAPDEQRLRWVLKSLLRSQGLDQTAYRARFGSDPLPDHPQLQELGALGLAVLDAQTIRLTQAGLERSDAIGPWLYSPPVQQRMQAYSWR